MKKKAIMIVGGLLLVLTMLFVPCRGGAIISEPWTDIGATPTGDVANIFGTPLLVRTMAGETIYFWDTRIRQYSDVSRDSYLVFPFFPLLCR
jgi:hypothetical protein